MENRTPNSFFLAFWLLIFSGALGIPFAGHVKRASFSLPVMKNVDWPRDGPMDVYRTYQKFGLEIPARLEEIAQSRLAASSVLDEQDGSMPSFSHRGDLLWTTPIGVGTPPQLVTVDLDTGSSDSWLFSTDTDEDDVKGQVLYDPEKSSTSQLIKNCTWSILYGDYSTSEGICYKDKLMLGEVEVEDMIIESATKASSMFTKTPEMSGLLGLGFSSLGQTLPKEKTLTDFLPGVLGEPVFTADLQHNGTGSFNFGFINESLYDDTISYVDVNATEGFWSVLHKGFKVAGEKLKYEFYKPREVIVDTGSTLLFIPKAAAETYYKSANGVFSYKEYGYLLPCNSNPPDFTVEVTDHNGNTASTTIPGAYMIYARVNDTACYGGMQTLGDFSSLEGILGDVYLKSGFAVFDIAQKRFGMATKQLNTSLEEGDDDEDSDKWVGFQSITLY